MVEWVVPAVVSALVPAVSWVVVTGINNEKHQAAHEAADVVQFQRINEHLVDLKASQKSQTEKLDRLVEGMLHDARRA